jgi:diacylglycerol kinase (ATP)
MPGQAAIVYHARAGRGRAARAAHAAAALLADNGWHVAAPQRTRHAAQAREELGPYWAARADLIVVVGGDGTLREIVHGLGPAGRHIVLGVLPLGNANVIARELGIPLALDRALRVLVAGRPRTLDAMRLASYRSSDESLLGLAMVEVGFGAAIVHRVHALRATSLKTLYRIWADGVYALAALQSLASGIQPSFSVSVDGRTPVAGYRGAVLANIATYGRSWRMAPAADAGDGHLDLVGHRHRSLAGLLRFYAAARRARRRSPPADTSQRGCRWTIRAKTPLLLQVDGDPHPPLASFTVEVIPRALKIMAPMQGAPS